MLSALQGLLGQTVGVVIELHFNHRLRPLAALRGVLISGTPPTSRRTKVRRWAIRRESPLSFSSATSTHGS